MTRSRHARRSYSSSSEHGHSRNRVRFNSDERSPLLGYRAVGNHPHLKVHLKSSQFVSTCLDLDVGKSEALAIFDEMDELHKGYVEADDIAEYIKRKEQELAELSKYYTSPEFWCMFIFLFSTFLRMMDNLLNLQFWCTDSIAFIGLFLGSIGNVVVALNAIKERKKKCDQGIALSVVIDAKIFNVDISSKREEYVGYFGNVGFNFRRIIR